MTSNPAKTEHPHVPGQPISNGRVVVRLPDDVKPAWLNVFRRLQSVASRRNGGLALLTIRVVVDETGTPVFWTEPSITLLEPKGNSTDILAFLAEQFPMNDK